MTEEEIKDLALKFQSGLIESGYQINQKLQQENEKLNHYKLLYQKVKERNDEAIEYIEGHMMNPELMDEFEYISTSPKQLLKILKGNIEEVSDEIK